MTNADFYIEECNKILGKEEGPAIVEFNSLADVGIDLFYIEEEKNYHFTLRPRVTHYAVRFNSAEGLRNFLRSNTSIFNRSFVEVAYVNKKPIITNAEKAEKTQKRRGK